MANKWEQFVNFLRPWIDTDYPTESLQACLQSVLGSMLSEKLCIENNVCTKDGTNLVIWEITGYDGKAERRKALMPIRLNNLNAILETDMDKLGCNIGMTVGTNIKLFYKPVKLNKSICVCDIAIDSTDSNGIKLFSLLTDAEFTSLSVNDFIKGLYNQINPKHLIFELLEPYILHPGIKFKRMLLKELANKGFEGENVHKILKELDIKVSYKGQNYPLQEDSSETRSTTSHDTTKFSIDGKLYLSKRNFVLQVVKQYVHEHPNITYAELNNVFRADIISKERGIVRPLKIVNEWIKTKPDLRKRYCMNSDEVITLSDGEQIVVYNQWGKNTFPGFLHLVEKFYNVQSDREYSEYPLSSHKGIVSENNDAKEQYSKGINISFGSLQNFKKRK